MGTTSDIPVQAEAPEGARYCVLEHPLFARIPDISFRRAASDGAAVMVMPFEEREATLPLTGIQREFDIADDSADGQMLALIAESLNYVTALHPGDPLPAEVVNGEASWTPSPSYLRRAQIRLRVTLLGWHDPASARIAAHDIEGGSRLETDPELKTALGNATRKAAAQLGYAGPEEVLVRLEALASEFAFIESLRDRLLGRVHALVARATRMAAGVDRTDGIRTDAITRVLKMTNTSLHELAGRFDKIDEICRDIIALLKEPETRVAFVRENRDMLYRNQLGWDPILQQWDEVAEDDDMALWQVVANTYQFLARRYLSVTEWPAFGKLRDSLSANRHKAMRW